MIDWTNAIAGAVVGAAVTACLDRSKVFLTAIRRWKLRGQVSRPGVFGTECMIGLDHADFSFEPNDLIVDCPSRRFTIAVPDTYTQQLATHGFDAGGTSIFSLGSDLELIRSVSRLPNYVPLLAEVIEFVAKRILTELEDGRPRSNTSLMFGVDRISGMIRRGKDERATLHLTPYETNYFTFRVMDEVYNRLRKAGTDFGLDNNYSSIKHREFAASFGVMCFVIVGAGPDAEVLLCRRSRRLAHSPGLWHYSMNEAFSENDVNNENDLRKPDLFMCLKRGLWEEMRIGSEMLEWSMFTDTSIDACSYQMGILAIVGIRLTESLTKAELLSRRASAKDADYEVYETEFVPLRSVRKWVADHSSDITDACKWGLSMMMARYESNLYPHFQARG